MQAPACTLSWTVSSTSQSLLWHVLSVTLLLLLQASFTLSCHVCLLCVSIASCVNHVSVMYLCHARVSSCERAQLCQA